MVIILGLIQNNASMEKHISPIMGIDVGASLARAYLIMDTHNLHQLVVLDHSKVVGVVTMRDLEVFLSDYLFHEKKSNNDFKVVNFMKSPVKNIDAKCDLSSVVEIFLNQQVAAITVSDNDHLLGILTKDILLDVFSKLFDARSMSVREGLKILEDKKIKNLV